MAAGDRHTPSNPGQHSDATDNQMEFPSPQNEILTSLVSRVLRVDEVTWGNPQRDFIVRYRGELLLDSRQAYEQLASSLRPQGVTPLFRPEDGRHAVILVAGVNQVQPSNPWINLVLFVATLFSVMLAGAIYVYQGPVTENFGELVVNLLASLGQGIPFAASLLAILLAQEFGHYLAGR